MCVSYLLNPVFCWWALGLLPCLGYYKVLLWKLGCIYLFKRVFSFFQDIYPWVKLVNHMVVLFLIFWGTSILFSIVDVPMYIFTNRVQGFPFVLILQLIFFRFMYFWTMLGLCYCAQAFSSCGERGQLSSCGAWASHCCGFSCCRAQAPGHAVSSVVAVHGLSSCGRQA